jgi:hypothetical protein
MQLCCSEQRFGFLHHDDSIESTQRMGQTFSTCNSPEKCPCSTIAHAILPCLHANKKMVHFCIIDCIPFLDVQQMHEHKMKQF